MKCSLFQKVDLAFVHWRKSIQKQPPRTECCFQAEGMSLEGHAASGPNWPGLNGNTIDERAGPRSLTELVLYSHSAKDQSRIAPAITNNA
jgi:hypothetical protein